MLAYYVRLAWKSLVATPWLTLLTLGALGLGIAVPTASLSIRHVFAQNPNPEKADRLYNVRLESWETGSEFFGPAGEPPKHVTYQDMVRVREMSAEMDPSVPSTGVGAATIFAFPEGEDARPFQAVIRLCHSAFFDLFDAPFAQGGPWTPEVDRSLEQVVVLSHEGNERLFGGGESVGESIRLGERQFTVIGVLAPWSPTPQYWDILNNPFGKPREIFLPFDFFVDDDLGLARATQSDSWGRTPRDVDRRTRFMASEMTWIQLWVELDPSRVEAYHDALDRYAMAQKELGRYPRPLNNRVTPMMEWLAFNLDQGAAPATDAMVIVSLLFLAVCCLNLAGLLLAKFLSRSGVLGVHRALGAPKRSIFWQRIVECLLVASAGGLVGALLAGGGLAALDRAVPDRFLRPELFTLDLYTFGVALLLALVAGVLSGLYPAWRACRVAPALQLKTQ